MGMYDFVNPGAAAGASIAKFLADREEDARKQAEQQRLAAESQERIRASQDQSKRLADEQQRLNDQQNIANAIQIRSALARGDMLTPDQIDALDKGHLSSAFDKSGGKRLDSQPVTGTAVQPVMQPGDQGGTVDVGPMQTGAPDASVPVYGIAKATPADLARDEQIKSREAIAEEAAATRAAAAKATADAAKERAQISADAAAQRAQEHNDTVLAVAGMNNNFKQTQAGEKNAEAKKKDDAAHQAAVDAANATLNAIGDLTDTDANGNMTLKPGTRQIVGGVPGVGRLPGFMVDTGLFGAATNAQAALNQLKSQAIVNLISEMKNQSRTGATGFGQLSDQERLVLENAAVRLNQAQTEPEFLKQLQVIKEKLLKVTSPSIDFQKDKE